MSRILGYALGELKNEETAKALAEKAALKHGLVVDRVYSRPYTVHYPPDQYSPKGSWNIENCEANMFRYTVHYKKHDTIRWYADLLPAA